MELTELRNTTKKQLSKNDIDLLDMVIVMIGDNGSRTVKDLFAGAGLSTDDFIRLAKQYKASGNSLPQSLLTDAICKKQGGPFNDIDLLEFVFSGDSGFLDYLIKNDYQTQKILDLIGRVREEGPVKIRTRTLLPDSSMTNMSEMAAMGRYDHLTGRKKEIQVIENILLRKDKANVILTGDAGVGKTAVTELLVKKSVRESNSRLGGYTFYSLDMTSLLSATPYRGQLEKKVSSLLAAVAKEKKAVLFIDEIHRINQSIDGISEGSQIVEMLKPYLTEDNIRIIGATTTDEYQKYILRHPALSRRFQQVRINELKGDDLFDVVHSYADALTKYHAIHIEDDMIKMSIELTDTYVMNRCQPDKTNELLDSACVAAANDMGKRVKKKHIIQILSATTHIPEDIICQKIKRPEKIEQRIRQQLFGQDAQVERAVRTIMVKMAGFEETHAPLASLIFAGDSGVGKTQLAKLLAKEILGDENAITVIDMSEFSERHSVSKLVGSPPGYIGSDREGILTHAIANHPFGIILFDEIEKAAPEVHKILLGMLDMGRIRSGLGIEYDAGNTALIFTTNAVTVSQINKQGIGFSNRQEKKIDPMTELEKIFPMEFLGRIDEVIMFNSLSDADYIKIIALNLQKIKDRFKKRGINMIYDEKLAADYIMAQYRHKQLGARSLLDVIRNKITLPIIKTIADSNGERFEIDVNLLIDRNRRTEAVQ